MIAPLSLRDPAARDAAVVGWKAALLSTAAASGLPVLPGVVVPLTASSAAIDAGAEALPTAGRAAAYLAASSVEPDGSSLNPLADVAEASGGSVVRSSTPLDDDGRWSGAFASYLDVRPDDLAAAVRGCWASVYTRDVLSRCEATGVEPGSLRVAALVQPFVAFEHGGTAHIGPSGNGVVRVSVGSGGAAGVVGGSAATTVLVGGDGAIDDRADVPIGVLSEVAALARRCAPLTGIGTIEWGWTGGSVVLLQVGPALAEPRSAGRRVRTTTSPGGARRVASLVVRFRGALADELVLPWALGGELPRAVTPLRVVDPSAALSEARSLADRLAARVWGRPPGEARTSANEAIHALRSGAVEDGLAALARTRSPADADARLVVGLLLGIGDELASAGVLTTPQVLWQLTVADVERAIAGIPPSVRGGPDRWEGFLADVALAHGDAIEGSPVADGVGAGQLHVVAGLTDIGRPAPRAILAAEAPLPQLAPLLWHCAGFVARGGSAGAHLFEVARSLGVPAVIGVSPADLGTAGSLVAVDGTGGVVATLSAVGTANRRPA